MQHKKMATSRTKLTKDKFYFDKADGTHFTGGSNEMYIAPANSNNQLDNRLILDRFK